MATVRLGFLSANSRGHGAHYDDFLRLLPEEADVQIVPLGLWQNSLYDLEGKAREHTERTTSLVAEHGWDGIALMGAPMQVQNPGHVEQLRSLLSIPATTALESGAAAVRAFGATRILLLTPFDDGLNAMLREFLTAQGLDVTVPQTDRTDTSREDVTSTEQKSAEEVYRLAADAFAKSPDVDAVYFQGAPLNPLHVLERLEADLGVPVVASNPAMFWHITSLLGHRLPSNVEGCGRLLREWPYRL